MIKLIRKQTAPTYQDANDLGLHPDTVILCSGFGVNPISKALDVSFIQIHAEANPEAIISHLPKLRFTDYQKDESFDENGKIIDVGYPTKDTVKGYLNFDFENSDVTLPESQEMATKAAIWLMLNSKWKELKLWEEWVVEYNGSVIELTPEMIA